jgi:predicted acyltransferase (DUF342 family)
MEVMIIILVIIITLFFIINHENNLEHLTSDEISKLNSEAIMNVASVYNNDMLKVSNAEITNNLVVRGTTTIKGLNADNIAVDGMSNLKGGVSVGDKSYFDNDVIIKGRLIVNGVIVPASVTGNVNAIIAGESVTNISPEVQKSK